MSSRYSCAIKTICRKVGNCVFVLNFPTLASRLWFSPARHSKFYNGGFPTIRSRWQTQKRDHPRRGGCRGHAHRISTSTGFVPAASADRLGRGTDGEACPADHDLNDDGVRLAGVARVQRIAAEMNQTPVIASATSSAMAAGPCRAGTCPSLVPRTTSGSTMRWSSAAASPPPTPRSTSSTPS